uniref:Peptidase M16 domain protein n=1 Tax=Solibacter usitatus (strain Ellin6076) TaxID=234267 RepID=Q029G5_SOLUE
MIATTRRFLSRAFLGAVAVCGLVLTAAPKPVQEVSRATLDNGLRVVIVRNSLAPVVTTVMNYLVGSNDAPEGFPGTAHALEHMMFRGSPELSADQLANIAAAMGGDFNADTQQSITRYFFTVPKQDLEVALHIESIRMGDLLASDALWEHERGAIEQEVAGDVSDPEYVLYTKLLSAMFRGTAYEHDALGTRASFDATTGGMLKKFYESWYAPNNAILVICGDVDAAATMATVKDLFGAIPAKTLPARHRVELEPIKPETLQLATDLPYGLAVAAFRWPGSKSPDFAAAQVLADVLGSERGGLRDLVPRGQALSASFSFDSFQEATLAYAQAAFPAGGDGAGLLRQVREVLAGIAKNGVAEELIDAAKRHETADAEFKKNSIADLAMFWSEAVALEGRQSPSDDIEAIQKVTADDVRRVARRLLSPEESMSAILRPQASGKPVSTSSFGKPESFASPDKPAAPLPEWAQKVNQLSIPVSNVHPQITTLSNGLRLIVQPVTASDTVSVFGRVQNIGLKDSKGQEGVDEVLDELLSYGTVSLDRAGFQKALDDIGANENAGADFSLEVPASEFDRGVALLAENQLHPALPASAFKTVQRQFAERMAGEGQSAAYLAEHTLESALLPKNDPDLRHATSRSVSSLSLKDVRNYYKRAFQPDLTTIVVVGNITPERAREVIERNFGSWKSHGSRRRAVPPAVAANQPSSTEVPNDSRVQADVTLAETLPVPRTDPDYYTLNLGSQVLGGAFYASRLSRDLRENSGLVYSVSSSLEAESTRAFYVISYGCDPRNVAKVRAIVQRDLKEMQTTAVPEETLKQAKVLLLKQVPLSEASVRSIAEGLISSAVNGLPLNEPIVAANMYAKVTAEQVQAAFAKWIRPNDFVEVIEGPSAK